MGYYVPRPVWASLTIGGMKRAAEFKVVHVQILMDLVVRGLLKEYQ